MIRTGKFADESREAGPIQCWCLHGAVGSHSDWRDVSAGLATHKISTRSVDLWRFLDCCPMPMPEFASALNAEAAGDISRPAGRVLVGYSMGGRLALHSLMANPGPWSAAVIISAHPGLEDPAERQARSAHDAAWAAKAFTGQWPAFLAEWDAQPILAGGPPRDPRVANTLANRRREIARSFVDWSLGAQVPLWDALPSISMPVLWVTGERDEKFHTLAQRAAALMPHARHTVAPGIGHRVHVEAPVWLANAISNFLQTP